MGLASTVSVWLKPDGLSAGAVVLPLELEPPPQAVRLDKTTQAAIKDDFNFMEQLSLYGGKMIKSQTIPYGNYK